MKQLIQEIINATEKYVDRMCWSNAVEALLTSGHKALDGAVYVDGWAIPKVHGVAIEHGWLELADGNVLDLTWLDCEAQYFAGVKYSAGELASVDPDFLPLVWTHGGWGGMQHAGYQQAYFDAIATSTGLVLTSK